MASLLFAPNDVEAFHVYRKRILLKVPLDLLLIEPIRETTPSVSLEDSSKENSEEETQERSNNESEHSDHQSQNGGGNKNEVLKKEKVRTTEEIVEQTTTNKQEEVHSTSTQLAKTTVIDLEKEWEHFNKKLHTDEKTPEIQTPKKA